MSVSLTASAPADLDEELGDLDRLMRSPGLLSEPPEPEGVGGQ